MNSNTNDGKKLIMEAQGRTWERYPVKIHLVKFGEDLIGLVEKYMKPNYQKGDWLAISEKLVSVCQNNVRHISTVKAGFLAKTIVKFVKKYPDDIGFSLPEKMQLAVETSGRTRMVLAIIIGGISKYLGIHGTFWRIAGHRVSEIDGFNPESMYPYNEYGVLPPKDPEKICQEIEDKLGIPSVIIDGNNINVKIISQSENTPTDKKFSRLALLDNPMGQGDEMTPFILVREIK